MLRPHKIKLSYTSFSICMDIVYFTIQKIKFNSEVSPRAILWCVINSYYLPKCINKFSLWPIFMYLWYWAWCVWKRCPFCYCTHRKSIFSLYKWWCTFDEARTSMRFDTYGKKLLPSIFSITINYSDLLTYIICEPLCVLHDHNMKDSIYLIWSSIKKHIHWKTPLSLSCS